MQRSAPRVRLYVDEPLAAGGEVVLSRDQAHYVSNVMRLGPGGSVAVFSARDGEWRAEIVSAGRGRCALRLNALLRSVGTEPDLWLLFAPVKRARIDFIAEKATELGVSALRPVLTARTAVDRVNVERLRANAVEAAEQCGRLSVPAVCEPEPLDGVLAAWPRARRLLVCDETGAGRPVAEALEDHRDAGDPGPWAVLIGPEGGFAPEELARLREVPFAVPVDLGPRVLRAETAAVAALSCWQARLGDWRGVQAEVSGPIALARPA